MEKPVYKPMWVNIDRERMVVTHKHPDHFCVDNLAYIELGHSPVVTLDIMSTDWSIFNDFEQRLLHENVCGQKNNAIDIAGALTSWCVNIPVSDVNTLEVAMCADKLPVKRDKNDYYRYVRGSNEASYLEQNDIPALVSVAGLKSPEPIKNFVSSNYKVNHVVREPIQSGNNPYVAKMEESQPVKQQRTPKEPGELKIPAGSSKTGRVWEIADTVLAANAGMEIKVLRKAIITACEAEGINSSTASVQYGKWKISKNI